MVFLEALKKEFQAIFKYKGLIVILFIGPVFLTLLFGGVYLNDYVKDIPIAIVDEDGTTLSHMVGNYFASNERFDVACYPASHQELQSLLDEGTVHMGLVIPKDFEKSASTYRSAEILVVMDGSNIVVSGNAYAQASQIIQTVSTGIEMKLIQGKSIQPQTAERIALVYNVGERVLYDPKMTYMNYLIICFFAVFIQQLFLSAAGSLFYRDRAYISSRRVLHKVIGTSGACLIGMIPAIAVSLWIIRVLFRVRFIGNLWIALLMTILFVLALTGPALLLTAVTQDRVKFSQVSFMLSLPTFISCGCIWPIEQMPKSLEIMLRCFWPLIHYAKPLQELLVKGTGFLQVLPNMLQLVLFIIVWLPLGAIRYWKAFGETAEKGAVLSIEAL